MSGLSHLMAAFGEAVLRPAIGCLFLIKVSLQLESAIATNLLAILLTEQKAFPAFRDINQHQGFKCTLILCYIKHTCFTVSAHPPLRSVVLKLEH